MTILLTSVSGNVPLDPAQGYTNGMSFKFRASATNTGNMTVNVDNVGEKQLSYKIPRTSTNTQVKPNYIVAGREYEVIYDTGTQVFTLVIPDSTGDYTYNNDSVLANSVGLTNLYNLIVQLKSESLLTNKAYGDYCTTNQSQTTTWQAPVGVSLVKVTIVGGGAAGGETLAEDNAQDNHCGSGAGASGSSCSMWIPVTGQKTLTIVKGCGGSYTNPQEGRNGGKSSVSMDGQLLMETGNAGTGSDGGEGGKPSTGSQTVESIDLGCFGFEYVAGNNGGSGAISDVNLNSSIIFSFAGRSSGATRIIYLNSSQTRSLGAGGAGVQAAVGQRNKGDDGVEGGFQVEWYEA